MLVSTLTGKTLEISVSLTETVIDLKEQILNIEGIPTDQQRLIYAGQQLIDDCTLAFYKLTV